MCYIIRKINRNKWPNDEIQNIKDFPADPITSCLRTSNNTLSFWAVNSYEKDKITDGVLAIVTPGHHLDTVDIIVLEKKEIDESNLEIEQTEGNTLIEGLKDNHYDLINLNYEDLGKITSIISKKFVKYQSYRYSKGELKSLIREAIESGKLDYDDLADGIAKHI